MLFLQISGIFTSGISKRTTQFFDCRMSAMFVQCEYDNLLNMAISLKLQQANSEQNKEKHEDPSLDDSLTCGTSRYDVFSTIFKKLYYTEVRTKVP